MSAILNPVPNQPASTPAAAPPVRKPNRSWIWLVALVVVAGAGYALWSNAQTSQAETQSVIASVKTAKVVTGTLTRTVRVSGQTAAREYVNVTVPRMVGPEANRPLVLLKLAPSGKMVKKGDVLMEIDGQAMQDHVEEVHSTVLQSEADIKKRVAEQAVEWEALQQSVRVAKAEADKARQDAKAAEVRTSIDQELMRLAVEEADAAYKELQSELTLKKVSQASEAKILDFTRERHARHRDRHKKDLTRFVVRAPMDGLAVVQSLFRGGEFVAIQAGDQVFPGQLVIKVVNPRSMQVEGNINQSESGNFRLGQKATVSLDAFPGTKFSGELYTIGAIAISGMRQQAYIRNIPVRVSISDFDPRIIPDLSASADIQIAQEESGTLVPLAALRNDGGKTVAYVKSGASFVPREVKIGSRNENLATVVTGLSVGDEVALNYQVAEAGTN